MQLEVGKRYRNRANTCWVTITRPFGNWFYGDAVWDTGSKCEGYWVADGTIGAGTPVDDMSLVFDQPEVVKPRAGRECPQQYRIKTLAEAPDLAANLSLQGQEWIAKYGGRTTEKGVLGNGRSLMLTIDGNVVPVDERWVEKATLHTWQDTGGLLWSYCTCCDASGEWDRAQYKYVERLDGKTVLSQTKETA